MTGIIFLIVLCVLLCPLSLVSIILCEIINHIRGSTSTLGQVIIGAAGSVILFTGYLLHHPLIPPVLSYVIKAFLILHHFNDQEFFYIWLTGSLTATGIAVLTVQILLYFLSLTPEKMMLIADNLEERRKLRFRKIDYVPTRSQVIVGVSGSGKSAFIGKSIEEIILKDKDALIYVVDGKGSTERYSLYYSCQLLAEKYNIPITLINGTANIKLRGIVYDFLDGVDTADSAKDMIMTLIDDPLIQASAGSEHYRAMTERYLLEVIDSMMHYDIDVTFHNVLTLLDPEALISALSQAGAPADEINAIHVFTSKTWPSVLDNVEKLKMFTKGEGAEIFMGSGERGNLRTAYNSGGIVLVLADEMSRPKLAAKLVQLISMDLRSLVASRLTGTMDMSKRLYVFYDEFSSYVSCIPLIRSLYAKCRSSETVMTLATQSCADIIGIDPAWFDILCNTADRFVVFRQHATSAEAAASIFGTEAHVTQTSRTSDLANTGESSNTADRSYVIPPDIIRDLPANVGIILDKTSKRGKQVKCFKNEFIKRR